MLGPLLAAVQAYPLYDYHQPYGTNFALMTLKRCE